MVSPWYHIGIDFIGPVSPTSTSGNRYILTIADYFTKFVEAVALPTKDADGVAITLFKVQFEHSCTCGNILHNNKYAIVSVLCSYDIIFTCLPMFCL